MNGLCRRSLVFASALATLVVADIRAAAAQALLDPLTQQKFVNPLPNPLDPSFIFEPQGDSHYRIGVYQTHQQLGLVEPGTGLPLPTAVWGYGNAADLTRQPPTYPGRTFEVQRGKPIHVRWQNELVAGKARHPLPHLLPVDTSIHWADPLQCGTHPFDTRCFPRYTGPVPIVTHLHGGHTEAASDGYPEAWFTPDFKIRGPFWEQKEYTYDNDQEAGTLWYHDHALGVTRLNVYAGMAGFYILRDNRDTGDPGNPLGLPAFPYEVPMAIQDRTFTETGQLFYPATFPGGPFPSVLPEFFGDFILVNGKVWPKLEVEPRKYRLRLLNGSDSRFYTLHIDADCSVPILQIGSDTGFLNEPIMLTELTLGTGERADVLVDFSDCEGQRLVVRNEAATPFPDGDPPDPDTTGQIMAFDVVLPFNSAVPDPPSPTSLRKTPFAVGPSDNVRSLLLSETMDVFGRVMPMLGTTEDGRLLWSDPITEDPMLGDVETWEFYNDTIDTHPIHTHLVSFEVIERQAFAAVTDPVTGALSNLEPVGPVLPPDDNERGPKDTVRSPPGMVTRVRARFDRPGRYAWHCHILSHEDNEMMRPYCVGSCPE